MANLTIAIDADLLRRARIHALEQGTSVNELLRQYLETMVGETDRRRQAMARFLELSETATGGSAPSGRSWKREDLYDRPGLR